MTIARVEFVGFTVIGPNKSTKTAYKPGEWTGWTAQAEGAFVIFEGEKRRIEVPRTRCIVYTDVATDAQVKRGPGRPPKAAEPSP